MDAVWQNGPAKHSHLVLLLRVADNINDVTGEWALSVPFLARNARLSERQAQRIIPMLEKEKWLSCRRDPGKPVVFRLGGRFAPQFNALKGKWEYGTPDKMTPLTSESAGGDISGTDSAPGGDTQMSPGGDTSDVTHTVPYPQDLTEKLTGAEAPAPAAHEGTGPVVIEIPLITLNDPVFRLRQSWLDEWRVAYPAVEARAMEGVGGVELLLRKARQWSLTHSQNRKTRGGMLKHLTGWLGREQDKAQPVRGATGAGGSGGGPGGRGSSVAERHAAIREGAGV